VANANTGALFAQHDDEGFGTTLRAAKPQSADVAIPNGQGAMGGRFDVSDAEVSEGDTHFFGSLLAQKCAA
jgi:hypothetical protein